ncbi:MAG: hypothetical protein QOD99_812 [Chthoniobacter sp.]|nr:hypothetical protein [Chthoniobacter sp.]
MLKQTLITAAVVATLQLAQAQDSALLDLLVKKKVLTAKEAQDVRADLVKEQAATNSTGATKIAIGSWVQEMKIGGDLRLRYQYDNRDFQVDPPEVGAIGASHDKDRSPSGSQRSRFRFRLRLNDDFKLTDHWFGGVQLATSPAADSGNTTLGSGFGKYNIFISRAFLGWNESDWLTLVGGKVPNPFYSTDLVWDPDINPDGFTQSVRLHKMHFGGSDEGSYSKDGKTFIAAEKQKDPPWELTLNFGEFIFSDNLENGNLSGNAEPGLRDNDVADDAWLFEGQLVASYKFDGGIKATVAPGLMFYNASRLTLPAGTNENQFSDTPSTVLPSGDLAFLGETRNLVILNAPGDISFKLGNVPTKFYWDFAWNTLGRRRAEEIYGLLTPAKSMTPGHFNTNHTGSDDFAYLLGVQVGENKKKGDVSAILNWRQTGITSVDPNLNDSDFALGELNTRGIKAGLLYSLTDFATFGVTYQYAWNLRDNLFGGFATGGPSGGVADSNVVQVLQVDLNVKF